MKRKEIVIKIITLLYILVWSYAAFSKLAVLEKSRTEMTNQVFPIWMAEILYWLIPFIELAICIMLIFTRTQLAGLYASLLLMSAFSIYIGITMTGVFGRVPCSCGGILSNMSYGAHLLLNLFFVSIAAIAICLSKKFHFVFTFSQFTKRGGGMAG